VEHVGVGSSYSESNKALTKPYDAFGVWLMRLAA
jgi:hypothetical protein